LLVAAHAGVDSNWGQRTRIADQVLLCPLPPSGWKAFEAWLCGSLLHAVGGHRPLLSICTCHSPCRSCPRSSSGTCQFVSKVDAMATPVVVWTVCTARAGRARDHHCIWHVRFERCSVAACWGRPDSPSKGVSALGAVLPALLPGSSCEEEIWQIL
jgi:hypothetical protein